MTNQQQEAIEKLRQWKVGALFMEAGTGKTRTAMELIRGVDSDMVLWIAPLRTITNLREEIEKWGGISNLNCVGIESIGQSDRIYLDTMEMCKDKKVFCVVDESLKIKNYTAKRTKRAIEIGKLCEYRLVLNGTPMSRDLLDVWSQFEFLSPKILNMSLEQFKNTFCKYTRVTKSFGWHRYTKEFITGYENIDYLYSLIRHYVYECDLHLNVTQRYHEVKYHIDYDAKEEYYNIKYDFLSDEELEWRNNNIFLAMTTKMQHCYCDCENKINAVRKIIDDEEHTIVFCRFVRSRELCEREFPKAKVLSYQKESFGLNLQNYHTTIYFDKVWDYALRLQSSRRTYRTGQTFDCEYYDVTGDVGLENLIDRNIDKKISASEYLKNASINDLKKDL